MEDYRKRIAGYNREALVHNLSLPAGIPHKAVLRADTLVQRALQGGKITALSGEPYTVSG